MIKFEKIKAVHLELSSFCNARCPLCPRNFKGYPYNDGYKETNLTLTQIQKIFDELFLQQLIKIYVNGNFGDMIMNPDTIDILTYFKSVNPLLDIKVSTNGSAKNAKFWQKIGRAHV